MLKPLLLRCSIALLGGIALAGAFEPFALRWLLPLGCAFYFLALHGLAPRIAWLPALLFGIGFFFTLLVWMRVIGTDAWLALSAVEALFLAALGPVVALFQHRLTWWPLAGAAAWVAVETIRGAWPFSGLPWGRLSYATSDTVWAAGLPWYGFTGVSFLIVLSGAMLAWGWLALWQRRPPRLEFTRGAVASVVVLGTVTLLPLAVPVPLDRTGSARIAVVQGDVPGTGDDLIAVHREVTRAHVDLTVELGEQVRDGTQQPLDLVVWPENSTAVDPFLDAPTRAGIDRAADAVAAPILVGAMVDAPDPEQVMNQGIVWHPGIGGGDRYTKRHPVPFGEYVPWRNVFTRTFGRLRQVPRDMVSGAHPVPLSVGAISVADAICFDVAYDDALHAQLRQGANLAVVQTSNAMFIKTHQIAQQYEITRLRAMESGRYLAVAAVNGVSGVIGPDGNAVVEASPRTQEVLVAEVDLIETLTPAVRLGPWPGRAAVLFVLGLVVVLRFRGRSRPTVVG